MKKSYYAAIFSAALSTNALAEVPEQERSKNDCIQMSATFKFCADENANSYSIDSPNTEPLLGIPGSLIENGGHINDNCALITTIEKNPLFVVCQDPETPEPAAP